MIATATEQRSHVRFGWHDTGGEATRAFRPHSLPLRLQGEYRGRTTARPRWTGGRVLWFNDIEDGFNRSPYSAGNDRRPGSAGPFPRRRSTPTRRQ